MPAGKPLNSLLLLDQKNFTPLKKTPWAGSQLAAGIKAAYVTNQHQLIGESWEISCDQDTPSITVADPRLTLSEIIASNPQETLSPAMIAAGRSHCEILVKLINASTPLSLQIHPADDNAFLKANECGKPESWLVLAAEPGSGLYLGFSRKMSLSEIENHLTDGTFSEKMLQFVPVKPGDFFEIAPGVPHAIGPGTVLLEPQRITPGKAGKTWRLWDWNRLYNENGQPDPHQGKARELHIKESLSLLQPDVQFGSEYVDTLRRIPKICKLANRSEVKIFPANKYYQVLFMELPPNARITMTAKSGFAGITMLSGTIRSASNEKAVNMSMGQSAFAPWTSFPMTLNNTGNDNARFSWIIPAGAGTEDHQGMVFNN